MNNYKKNYLKDHQKIKKKNIIENNKKKMIEKIFFFLIITTLIVLYLISVKITMAGSQDKILDSDYATLNLDITNEINIIGSIEHGEAILSWFPKTSYNQKISELTTNPKHNIKNNKMTFVWDYPSGTSDTKIKYSISSIIKTNNDITPVKNKILFPIDYNIIPNDINKFIRPSEKIDVNNKIKNLATSLATSNDLYQVVFNLADWVTTNINYNLTTVTANAIYPSSWVLDNRYGVCDEMTNLFISLNRALGIPARFVSGLSYTNIPGTTQWGGHGWAEVYFPKSGWIPFDVTYGEYGYIDAGHIKLSDSVDSKEDSVEFNARGKDFKIKTKPLDFNVNVINKEERKFDIIEEELSPYAKKVNFGSYNLMELRLKNLRNYYVSTRIDLGTTTGLSHENSDSLNILLKPFEEKKTYFLVKVDKDLDPNFIYKFPVNVYTKLSSSAESSFQATINSPLFKKDDFKEFLLSKKNNNNNNHIFINCSTKEFHKPGRIIVKCELLNKEKNINSKNIEVCTKGCTKNNTCKDDCKNIFLIRDQPKEVSFSIIRNKNGINTVPIIVKSIMNNDNNQEQGMSFVTFEIINNTNITFDINYSKTITYNQKGTISFEINSKTPINNVKTSIHHEFFDNKWDVDNLNQKFIFSFFGKQLDLNENLFKITITYKDVFGQEHNVEKNIKINLIGLNWKQKIVIWSQKAIYWLEGLFKK